MKGNDNASAFRAANYDANIRKSIPFYEQIHEAALRLVAAYRPNPETWIDIGCGTGTFVETAHRAFKSTEFILSDPSAAMLEFAAQKLRGRGRLSFMQPVGAEQLALARQVDVATAIQSLHYLDEGGRRQALQNCHRLLKIGGIFVTFENIRPLTQKGTQIGRTNWEQFDPSSTV